MQIQVQQPKGIDVHLHGHFATWVHDFFAETRDRAGDLQIFSLTLSQLSYRGF